MPQTRQPPVPPHPPPGPPPTLPWSLPLLLPCRGAGLCLLGTAPSESPFPPWFPSLAQGLLSEGPEGGGEPEVTHASAQGCGGGVRAALLVCTPFPLPSPWGHWGQEIGCSDSISNYETNLNPVLAQTLFLESHRWGGTWASGMEGGCCGHVGGKKGG